MSKPIVYIMQEVADAVKAELMPMFGADTDTMYIRNVNFMYGHWVEISERLMNQGKSATLRFEKFPIIVLLEDIIVDEGGDTRSATLQMLIMHATNNKYHSEERQRKVFDPILYPIYDELFRQLEIHEAVVQASEIDMPRTRIDRKYFGREQIYGNSANIPAEFVDAIQIQNLELTFYKDDCWPES